MRTIRRFVIVLVVLWLVVEVVAMTVAAKQIEKNVSAQTHDVTAVHASVGTFPVVARYLFSGEVKSVGVTLEDVKRLNLTFTQVHFGLEGVALSRTDLLHRRVHITAIKHGTVTATIDIGALPAGLSRLVSRVGNVHVNGRTLLLGGTSFPLASDILPCTPDVRVANDQVIVSCSITDVPAVLLDTAQRS